MRISNHKIVTLSATMIFILTQFLSGQSERIDLNDSTGVRQKDIVDVLQSYSKKQLRKDYSLMKGSGPFFSIIPAVGYAMHTGITGAIVTSTSFYSDVSKGKLSNILLNGYYSQYHQY